ncbi:MAG: rRNA adenine N-6-methyltransferase family protein [Pseudomonadota bacterium]
MSINEQGCPSRLSPLEQSDAQGRPGQWMAEMGLFLRRAFARPFEIGAQFPSSRYLCDALADAAIPDKQGVVVEFGPGTGNVTDSIVRKGHDPKDLILIENDPIFCAHLRSKFPGATVIQSDAIEALRPLTALGAIGAVSGLPLVNFEAEERAVFLRKVMNEVVTPGGKLAQFTYFFKSPLGADSPRGISIEKHSTVWRNLWPAVVWTYCQEESDQRC